MSWDQTLEVDEESQYETTKSGSILNQAVRWKSSQQPIFPYVSLLEEQYVPSSRNGQDIQWRVHARNPSR